MSLACGGIGGHGERLECAVSHHGPTENSGTITLSAGVPAPIRLEYYNAWGGA